MGTLLVGLTGGIGSGKSAAAERFVEHGIAVVDADLASRAVVEPGQPALIEIAKHFGEHILLAEGGLDRTALRHLVFANDEERHWLQSLLHPLISNYLRDQISAATSAYVILANPLLFESRQHSWCQRVLVIDVPEQLQISRTIERDNNTPEQVENIMRAQVSRTQRLESADDVITNDQDLAHLYAQVDIQHQQYLEICQTQPA
jgi:dephospho-CoA kinase